MEIIQQKLIWLLGSSAILILLFKLKLARSGMRKPQLIRLRVGVMMILFGSVLGILLKAGLSESSLSSSGTAYFLETILGYTFGWSFILWGLMGWALSYFDLRGRPLSTAGSRLISEIVMKSLLRGDGGNLLFNSVINDLNAILNCKAVTFHQIEKSGNLKLAFQNGLTDSSTKLVRYPKGEANVFCTALKSRQAVISDLKHTMHEFSFPETAKGPVSVSISIPVNYNGEILGILSAYRIKDEPFIEDDLKLLEVVASGLGASLYKEKSEKEFHLEGRYKELLEIASKPMNNGQPMISALIKSAKVIRNYLPLKWICLYLSGDGAPQSYEFNLPTGGSVKIIEGWFSKSTYPHLFNRDPHTGSKIGVGNTNRNNQRTYVFPIGDFSSPEGYLEIELQSSTSNNSYLSLLGNILGRRLALYLKDEEIEKLKEKTESWIGALEYYQNRAMTTTDLSSLLMELASMAVDLTPTSFCRIMLADSSQKSLKTVALAQARELKWNLRFETSISLSNTYFHSMALDSGEIISFNQEDPLRKLSAEEAFKLVSCDAKCGTIVPLTIGQKTVGLITIGDCRNASRVGDNSGSIYFLNALAAMISQVLTWQKEKRISKEGMRKLTLLKKAGKLHSSEKQDSDLNVNSRINGPLTGIITACEYLKSGLHTETKDYNRYLKVIERNAMKIHSIMSSEKS